MFESKQFQQSSPERKKSDNLLFMGEDKIQIEHLKEEVKSLREQLKEAQGELEKKIQELAEVSYETYLKEQRVKIEGQLKTIKAYPEPQPSNQQLSQENNQLKAQNQALQQQKEEISSKLTSELEKTKALSTQLSQEDNQLKAQNQVLQHQKEELARRCCELEVLLKQLEKKIKILESDIRKDQDDAMENEKFRNNLLTYYNTISNRNEELKYQLAQQGKDNQELQSSMKELHKTNQDLRAALSRAEIALHNQHDTNEALLTQNKELMAKLERVQTAPSTSVTKNQLILFPSRPPQPPFLPPPPPPPPSLLQSDASLSQRPCQGAHPTSK